MWVRNTASVHTAWPLSSQRVLGLLRHWFLQYGQRERTHSFVGNAPRTQMASPDYEAAEVLWEMSSLAAPQSKGSENVMPGGLQTSGVPLNAAGRRPQWRVTDGMCCQLPQLYLVKHKTLSRGFTFLFLPFFPISPVLSIIIGSLYFYIVTICIYAKMKVWIHPQMSSCCFPASVSKYVPHNHYNFIPWWQA